MTRTTLAAILAAAAALIAAPAATAATYQPVVESDPPASLGGIVVHVGDSVTFTNTTPCPSACSQTWTWFNGVNRLGYFMGYGTSVTYTFSTPRSGPVQLEVGIPTYPGSRLVRKTPASVYVTVLPAEVPS